MDPAAKSLDLAAARQIDDACDDFERRWRVGERPRVEDYVARLPESLRIPMFRALLAVELELAAAAGSTPSEDEYHRRFPKASAIISEVFAEHTSRRAGTGETSVSRESVRTGSFKTEAAKRHGKPAAAQSAESTHPTHIGRFEVRAVLGEGAFGTVYRAHDPRLDREVAIKVPKLAALGEHFDPERFLREAKSAASLRHPNICPVFEADIWNGRPYIVMAFIEGQTLADHLKNRKSLMPPKQAGVLIQRLALALQTAHDKGIVHRDLKPANVLIDRERKDVLITDFGLARRNDVPEAERTASGVIMGTPAYMSPEQARGDTKSIGPHSDIYALGVMLYELLTGQRPFSGSTGEVIGQVIFAEPQPPSKLRPGVDACLEAVCLKAMAKDPAQRYESMRALASALNACLREGSASKESAASSQPAATTSTGAQQFQEMMEQFAAEQRSGTERAVAAAIAHVRIPLWKWLTGAGFLAVLLLGGAFFFVKTSKAEVYIRLDLDLEDKSLSYILNDKPISAEELAKPIELKFGEHVLVVKRGDQVIRTVKFKVSKEAGDRIEVIDDIKPKQKEKEKEKPPPIPASEPEGPEWARIFNGKDLTGWEDLLSFSVDPDGNLVAAGGHPLTHPSWLLTKKDYSDFVLRLEFMFVKPGATNNGVALRAPPNPKGGPGSPKLQVQIRSEQVRPWTGSVLFGARAEAKEGARLDRAVEPREAPEVNPAGQWNTLEIDAVGPRVKVTVNGKLANDADLSKIDRSIFLPAEKGLPQANLDRKSGRIGLQNYHMPVKYRNIRIKELGQQAVAPSPDRAAAEYLLEIGSPFKVNGQERAIRNATDLPKEPYRITWVHLAWNKKVTREGMAKLKGLDELRYLSTGDTPATDAEMAHFSNCKELEEVNMHGLPVTNDGLAHFKGCTKLKVVGLGYTKVTDAGLEHLKNFPDLNYVNVKNSRVTADGVKKLHAALPQCRIESNFGTFEPADPARGAAEFVLKNNAIVAGTVGGKQFSLNGPNVIPDGPVVVGYIEASRCSALTDEALVAHAAGLTKLKRINGNDMKLTGTGFAAFRQSELEALDMNAGSITDAGLEVISKIPTIGELAFPKNHITDAGLKHLPKLPKLWNLDLRGNQITDAGAVELAKCTNLRDLGLDDTGITDKGLEHLKALSRLGGLHLQKTKVTIEGVKKLHAALPKCQIFSDFGTFDPTTKP